MKFFRLTALLLAASLSMTSCGFIIVNDISGQQQEETEAAEYTPGADDYVYGEYTKYDASGDGKQLAEQILTFLQKRLRFGSCL